MERVNVGTSAPPKPAQATGVLTERLDATPEPGRSGLLPMGSVLFGVAATTPGAGPRLGPAHARPERSVEEVHTIPTPGRRPDRFF